MRYIILVFTLTLLLAFCFSDTQISNSYNLAVGNRGAGTYTYSRALVVFSCGYEKLYRRNGVGLDFVCIDDSIDINYYDPVLSDSRTASCVPALNSPVHVIGLDRNRVVKRIFVNLQSSAGSCTFIVRASSSQSTQAAEVILNQSSVLGPTTFLPDQVNAQNKGYRFYSFEALSANNNPCSICAIEMFQE